MPDATMLNVLPTFQPLRKTASGKIMYAGWQGLEPAAQDKPRLHVVTATLDFRTKHARAFKDHITPVMPRTT